MTFAPVVTGYESTVGWVTDFLRKGTYVPMGDPDKAARVLIELAEHPEPPVHLILGSEAIGIVKQAECNEKWRRWKNGYQLASARTMTRPKTSCKPKLAAISVKNYDAVHLIFLLLRKVPGGEHFVHDHVFSYQISGDAGFE